MKKTIRRGVFETNSSSSHVLSIPFSKEQKERFTFNPDCISNPLIIEEKEFTMEGNVLYTPEEKIEYIYALNCSKCRYETDEEFEEFLREFVPENVEIQFKKNEEVYCHVDWQSSNLLDDAYISWREFITGPYILSLVGDWV